MNLVANPEKVHGLVFRLVKNIVENLVLSGF